MYSTTVRCIFPLLNNIEFIPPERISLPLLQCLSHAGSSCSIICMEKSRIRSCLSASVLRLLHIWPLNCNCWKQGEIYSHLDRVSYWASGPAPPPSQPWSPTAHMGVIICKVAAVAPGNDLKGVCAGGECAGTRSQDRVDPFPYHTHVSGASGTGGRGERLCCCVGRAPIG